MQVPGPGRWLLLFDKYEVGGPEKLQINFVWPYEGVDTWLNVDI